MANQITIQARSLGLLTQIKIMAESLLDPHRAARSENPSWDEPFGAAFLAYIKIRRILQLDNGIGGRITGDLRKAAEELRESASYALRAAQLLDERADIMGEKK